MGSKQILYATDYSESSQQALRCATWLAQSTEGKLYIVHVSDREPYPVGELFEEVPNPDPQGLDQLESVVPEDATVPYEHRLLFGEPGSVEITKSANVIVDFANNENVDMITLGTHGRSGFGHMLMGSVAESVVRNADCPVVTVRQSKESQMTNNN
jgi:nucleotide-binding universal stress UspA family protein